MAEPVEPKPEPGPSEPPAAASQAQHPDADMADAPAAIVKPDPGAAAAPAIDGAPDGGDGGGGGGVDDEGEDDEDDEDDAGAGPAGDLADLDLNDSDDDDDDFVNDPNAPAAPGERVDRKPNVARLQAPATLLSELVAVALPDDAAAQDAYVERALVGFSNLLSDIPQACKVITAKIDPPKWCVRLPASLHYSFVSAQGKTATHCDDSRRLHPSKRRAKHTAVVRDRRPLQWNA